MSQVLICHMGISFGPQDSVNIHETSRVSWASVTKVQPGDVSELGVCGLPSICFKIPTAWFACIDFPAENRDLGHVPADK